MRLFASVVLMLLPITALTAPLAEVGRYEVIEEDFVYAEVDGVELRAHSYRPKKSGPLPAAVEAHGGAWNLYDRMAGDLYNKALASAGLYVLAVDFRQGPDYQHPLGSRDIASAVRFLRHNAESLNIDAASIGLIGSSSGGHLALLAGLKPNDPVHQGTPVRAGESFQLLAEVDASVAYIIPLWPVSDPLYRFGYAKEVGRERLIEFHQAYFGDENAMGDASVQRLLRAGEAVEKLPPILVVQPGEDTNIPRPMTFDLMAAYQDAGGQVDYHFYPGMPHAFAHRPSASTDECIDGMRSFINRSLSH